LRFAVIPTKPDPPLLPSPPNGRRRPLWLAASVLLFVLGAVWLAVLLGRSGDHASPTAPAIEGPRVSPAVAPSKPVTERRSSPIDRVAAPPRWIRIPAIGVSAPVIPLGLNPDRTLQTPQEWGQTGWYTGGPEPGEQGPAVIAGHVDSTSGPAVFYRLGELHRGAVISIRRADRSNVRFRVQGVERWAKDRFPTRRVYGRRHIAALRLITCGGAFDSATGHYLDNTIVYAARVSGQRS
jgi:sortase (surface protein transpeptidase)